MKFELNGLMVEFVQDMQGSESIKNMEVISGGMSDAPDWPEYLTNFTVDYWLHLELMRHAITEAGWIGRTGGDVCNYYHFVFSDGVVLGFTWRAWGDLMQAIVGKREGYMKYYMER